jgi:drug/metabolite transporter (DMT)-like permease
MKGQIYLWFAVLGITWGSLWLVTGGSVDPVPLLCEGTVHYGLAALALGIYAMLRKGNDADGTRFSYGSGVVMGLGLLAVPYAATALASGTVHPYLRATAAGLPAVVYGAMPLAVMLMVRADAGRYLPRLLFGLTGVALLVAQGLRLDTARWLPEVVLAAGMLVYGLALVYAARELEIRLNDEGKLNTPGWCAVQCATASTTLALGGVANGDWARLAARIGSVEPGRWFGLVIAAGITFVTLPLLYFVLEVLEPIQVAAVQWLITVTGALEAAIFLPVAWSWRNGAGLVITLAALWWVLQEEPDSGPTFLMR